MPWAGGTVTGRLAALSVADRQREPGSNSPGIPRLLQAGPEGPLKGGLEGELVSGARSEGPKGLTGHNYSTWEEGPKPETNLLPQK